MPKTFTLGAIDAGSNALRVIVARYENGALRKLAGKRAAVRLGHGAFTSGVLDDATIDAAVEAFRGFRAMFDEHAVDLYRAVATSALRSAHNADVLLHRLHHEAKIEVEVISGDEEARLVRKAVTHAFADRPAPRVILDLGGGSFEVNVRRGPSWRAASMPIGTVRLVETFGLTEAIEDYQERMIRRAVRTMIDHEFGGHVDGDMGPAAACGGNAEALAKLFGQPEDSLPALQLATLQDALPSILDVPPAKRMKRFSVRKDRAEVMGVAAVVFDEAADALHLDRLFVPGVGIRDAVLLDLSETLAESDKPKATALGYAMLTSARTFCARVGHDVTHSEHIRGLARSLFDQLSELHGLSEEDGALLEVAAMLHDVGVVVNPKAHHRHGEYMVMSGRIPGLASPAREIVAAVVRGHRKALPDEERHAVYASLSGPDRARVRRLVALLRLADGLDTDHRHRVERVTAKRHTNAVALAVDLRSHREDTGAPRHAKSEMFEAEFGVEVSYDFRDL